MLSIQESARNIPVKGEYDVVVCGGGIAGISAALAAQRTGARTLLLEKEYLLGGLGTAGIVTIYLPLCDGMGRQVSFGIAQELLRLSVSRGCEGRYPKYWLEGGTVAQKKEKRFEVQYNPNVFAVLCEQLLLQAGVDILYGTMLCAICEADRKITHVLVENKSGRTAYGVKSVVDCTGDADVCARSTAATENFSEGNVLAGWYYFLKDGHITLKMVGFADVTGQGVKKISDDRFLGLDGEELSRITVRSHAATLQDFLKDGGVTPDHALTMMATIPQVRMTRRIAGVQTLDLTADHREFADSVGLFSNWRKAGPVYELPFGTLYGKELKNLICAGRCISVTDAMWDISRVIPVCAVSGQAAGTAAAMTDDFAALDIAALQQKLQKDGVVLHERDL